jgi:hypothetical protein
MKTITGIFLFLAITIALSSCKKHNISTSTMQALVDTLLTDTLTHDSIFCNTEIYADKNYTLNVVHLQGAKGDSSIFTFTIPKGTVDFYSFNTMYNGILCEASYIKNGDHNNPCHSESGSITIETNNGHRITGTFNFAAKDTLGSQVDVKDGKFDVEYDVAL